MPAKHHSEDSSSAMEFQSMDTPSGHTFETSWFRESSVFLTLEQKILPDYLNSLATGERDSLRIWSAGCATGQETYSLALLIEKLFQNSSTETQANLLGKIEIIGTDRAANALQIAQRGLYNDLSMARGLPPDVQEKAFNEVGNIWQISPLRSVKPQFKLQDLNEDFVMLGHFDVVLLCHVVDAFTAPERAHLYPRLRDSLQAGGCLLMDKPEPMLESHATSAWFESRHYGQCHYYQKLSSYEANPS
jgi:chemotaxis protein methyltransferase CheR